MKYNIFFQINDTHFWRQGLIILGAFVYSMDVGFMLGYPSVLTPALLSPNITGLNTTSSHTSWIVASNGFGGTIGSFVIAFIFQVYGRKILTICINLGLLIGWIIFLFATNIESLYAARIIHGMSVGAGYTTVIIVSEYVDPSRRGTAIVIKKVAISIGILCCHTVGPFFTWRQIAMFPAAFQIVSTLITLFWPESPYYLAQKGRIQECEKSFKWLYGSSEESQKRLTHLIQAQVPLENKENGIRQLWRLVQKKDFQKSFLIITILTLTVDVCGRYYIAAYVTQILMAVLESKSSVFYVTLGLDLLIFTALCSSGVVVCYFRRRTLLLSCGSVTVVSMLVISALVFVASLEDIGFGMTLSTVAVMCFQVFVSNIGLIPVTFTLIGEVMPLESKGINICISGAVSSLFYAFVLKITPILMEHVGVHGTFLIYGILLTICLGLLFKILPETKDKTLQEIEDDINGFKK